MRLSLRLPSIVAVALLTALALAGTARAADPDDGAWIPLPPEAPPDSGAGAAASFDPDPRTAAGPPDVPRNVPPDVYRVTETYAWDEVVRDGARTTYRTVTVNEAPGTYARAIDTVATGQRSAFDGTAFNGRARLSDGRAIAGTYYQTFVPSDESLVPVSIVFFQDDSELAPGAGGAARGSVGSASRGEGRAPAPDKDKSTGVAVAGVSLTPGGAFVGRIEVLRARTASLWFSATADGVPVEVRGWRVISAEAAIIRVPSGGPADPLIARWDRLAAPDAVWRVVVALTLGIGPGAGETVAAVDVVVRSPALVH